MKCIICVRMVFVATIPIFFPLCLPSCMWCYAWEHLSKTAENIPLIKVKRNSPLFVLAVKLVLVLSQGSDDIVFCSSYAFYSHLYLCMNLVYLMDAISIFSHSVIKCENSNATCISCVSSFVSISLVHVFLA